MHCCSKRWYRHSSKVDPRREVVRHERKVARIRALRKQVRKALQADSKASEVIEEQKSAARRPEIHHYIGSNKNIPVPLSSFVIDAFPESNRDPVFKVCSGTLSIFSSLGGCYLSDSDPPQDFLPRLQKHLLSRLVSILRSPRSSVGASLEPFLDRLDPTRVCVDNHRIFYHKLMRVKFTTYDVRRDEDVIHLDSECCNIMVPNPAFKDDQSLPPYLYARVLGIYHGMVYYAGEMAQGIPSPFPKPIRIEFLWVRWYETVPTVDGERFALNRIHFPAITSADSTSFIDPSIVLRAAHIIPRFSSGKAHLTGQGLSKFARDGTDWCQYVNRYVTLLSSPLVSANPTISSFADRDMFMRQHIGMAVGHAAVWPHIHGISRFRPGVQARQEPQSTAPLPPDQERGPSDSQKEYDEQGQQTPTQTTKQLTDVQLSGEAGVPVSDDDMAEDESDDDTSSDEDSVADMDAIDQREVVADLEMG